jgi:hypothetical protein
LQNRNLTSSEENILQQLFTQESWAVLIEQRSQVKQQQLYGFRPGIISGDSEHQGIIEESWLFHKLQQYMSTLTKEKQGQLSEHYE